MKKCIAVLFLLLAMGFSGPCALAEPILTDLNLQVEGRAEIEQNDIARARTASVQNALENAIMQTAAKILASEYDDEKFQAVKSILIGRADQYVKNYRITSENRQQGEFVTGVTALVAQSLVRRDLIDMGLLQNIEAPVNTAVSLVLREINQHSDFTRLRSFLQSRSKIVKTIYPCAFQWRQVRCDLVIMGDLQELIAELDRSEFYIVEEIGEKPEQTELVLRTRGASN